MCEFENVWKEVLNRPFGGEEIILAKSLRMLFGSCECHIFYLFDCPAIADLNFKFSISVKEKREPQCTKKVSNGVL